MDGKGLSVTEKFGTHEKLPAFSDRLVSIPDFLPQPVFEELRSDILRIVETERNYIPAHKKGGTIAYDTLRATSSKAVELYSLPEYQDVLSRLVGARLFETPTQDQSSLSVLFYEKPGDHIGWHYDHNFYFGRHFTALIPLENRNADGCGLSSAKLLVKRGESIREIPTPPNTLVFFEGAKTLHRVTQLKKGERRIVLSMTYATDPRNSKVLEGVRRMKDVAFIGIRALWT